MVDTADSLPEPRSIQAGTVAIRTSELEVGAISKERLLLAVRNDQQLEWERGAAPRVEDYLGLHPHLAADTDGLVDLIFHEYLLHERYRGRPSLDEFARRFPDHAVALRMQVALHKALRGEQAAPRKPDDSNVANVGARSDRTEPTPQPVINGYEVLDEVGRGGMAVVYRARQVGVNRLVALKVLSPRDPAHSNGRERFRAEAEMIARLEHSNIVQIYEAGEQHGLLFLSLEFVGGGSLRERLDGAPKSPTEAARLVSTLARTIQTAHTAGVVHRDLKPANILFTSESADGTDKRNLACGTPKITDFGLAKSLDVHKESDEWSLTQTGDVCGTPCYMSPEQASGRTAEIGPATDIYSLGAILYELITGVPPIRGATAMETLQMVIATDPLPPSKFQPQLPRDLETICLKCLEKAPARRYASALDMADDLQRFLAGESIAARPTTSAAKIARWCRRQPVLAGLMTLAALLVAIVTIGSVTAALLLEQAALDRQAEANLADARLHRLGNQLGRRELGLAALAAAARIRPTPEVRDEAIATLALFDFALQRQGPAFTKNVIAADFDPGLTRYVQWRRNEPLIVRRVDDSRVICRLPADARGPEALMSRTGRYVACRNAGDPNVEIWSVGADPPQRRFREPCAFENGIGAVDFSPDDRWVAIGSPDRRVRIYDLDDSTDPVEIPLAYQPVHVAFHPRRSQLAVATVRSIQIRDSNRGTLLVELEEAAGSGFICWHPGGSILAATGRDEQISLWEPDQRRLRSVLAGHSVGGTRIAFDHAGSFLFSTAWDGMLRVWDPHQGEQLFATNGSMHYVLRFNDDDHIWAGEVAEGFLQHRQIDRDPVYRRLTPESTFDLGHFGVVSIARQGRSAGRLLAVAMQRGVGFWDLTTRRPLGHLPIGETGYVHFDETGRLFTGNLAGVQTWPVMESADRPGALIIGPPERLATLGTVSQIASSADGRVVAMARGYEGGLLIDREDPKDPLPLTPHLDVRYVAVTRDGRLAATGAHNGTIVKVWNAQSGRLIRELPLNSSRVEFSPDGRRLLTTGDGLQLWSVDTWESSWTGEGSSFSAHAFSADGKFVAVDVGGGTIVLYRSDDGQVVGRFRDPYQTILRYMAIAVDGRSLVGVSRDLKQLFVWDLQGISEGLLNIGSSWDYSAPVEPARDTGAHLSLTVTLTDPVAPLLAELAAVDATLRSDPENAVCHQRRGRLLQQLRRGTEAVSAFARSVSLDPQISCLIDAAQCESDLQNIVHAIDLFRQALDHPSAPDWQVAQICNAVSWTYCLAPPDLRDSAEALEFATRAVRFQPDNPAYLNTLGVAYFRAGEAARAIDCLNRSLQKSSNPAFDLYFLALCHHQAGIVDRSYDYAQQANYWHSTHAREMSRRERDELRQIRREVENCGFEFPQIEEPDHVP